MFSKNPQVLPKDLHAEQWNKQILANFSSAEISLGTFFINERKYPVRIGSEQGNSLCDGVLNKRLKT